MGRKLLEQVITLFTAAIGVMAALAWNDAVQALFNSLFPQGEGIKERFIFAILITAIAVLITTIFASLLEDEKD
ncbi:hypothetical protein H1D32_03610 [Anaerobacillus sp. CMMVII]|uniref:DUF5654 family protein n=1 Tax=Anaerobacillus sp. CMMVII TaxID=2755588 RepID=UPI0021B7EF33|nr:DUF5654 family protein [Anaerobacillus sp. CMMVII]MCT8136920.1 hypothetical protein [Anaerobacillus sp. CMMVII]